MSKVTGKVAQIVGPVIDVEFATGSELPKIYDSLEIARPDGSTLVLEVQQQLGDGVVRCIAMGSSEGMSRGMKVTNTGAPISVPVGQETLGRIMDVLGNLVTHLIEIVSKHVYQQSQKKLSHVKLLVHVLHNSSSTHASFSINFQIAFSLNNLAV